MIKKETKTKTVIEKRRFCDFCDTELKDPYTYCNTSCHICGRDMCRKHRTSYRDPECYQGGDYETMVCIECDRICDPYFAKLKGLLYKYDIETEKISEEMKKLCKENAAGKTKGTQ